MSRFDFENVLKQYDGDPSKILQKYNYDSGEDIYHRLSKVERFDSQELNDIINMIVLWKTNRRVLINDDTLKTLREIQSIKTKEEVLDEKRCEKVKALLTSLLNSKGLKLPMASTLLHFFNKDCFPIIDQRAYRVIYKEDYKEAFSVSKRVDLYMDYLGKCIDYYNQNLKDKIDYSDIDKYLYQVDIEIGNKVNY